MPQTPTLERPATAVGRSARNVAVRVTPDNFRRAETDMYFGGLVAEAGGPGRLHHHRAPVPIDNQTVIRLNRDTLYSACIIDLDAGPVRVALPDAGDRFMSLMVLDEDQYVHDVAYDALPRTYTREGIGTRYVLLGVRTLADPGDAADLAKAHALQDAIHIEQAGPGSFEVQRWDAASQKRVRDALLALAATLPETRRMFGAKAHVDPVRHLIGTASAWGGNPETEALYLNVTPERNDGTTPYRLKVGQVPVDAFWSISVYNQAGYFEPNDRNAYSLNSITAKRERDGSVEIRFGGRDGGDANVLPITPGWNYLVRLYRPRPEVLSGAWTFPDAEPVG